MERHLSKAQPIGMERHCDGKSVSMPMVNVRLPMSAFLNVQYQKSPFLVHKLHSTQTFFGIICQLSGSARKVFRVS